MQFLSTKYGINAKKSVHFVDVCMGGIFLGGSPWVLPSIVHHGVTVLTIS